MLLVGVVAALLLLAALSATMDSAVEVGQGWIPGVDQETPAPQTSKPNRDEFETPPAVRAVVAVGMLLTMLAISAAFLLGLATILMSIRFGRRRRRRLVATAPDGKLDDGTAVDVNLMRRAAGGALDRLGEWAGGDPGDAVVLAWLALEQAARECGLARQPHQTPTEFTTAVLTGLAVHDDALDRLRRLYQRARFSTHPITDSDVRAAQAALSSVVADLDAIAPAAVAAASGAAAAVSAAAAEGTAVPGSSIRRSSE